jgi:hypothetical protein
VTEIIDNDAGEPYWFAATGAELRQAIDAIPSETLLAANRAVWTSRGLEPPKMTAAGLRKKLLAKHLPAASRPDDVVLPIEEAARHLKLTGRVLRYRIQQGEFEGHTRPLPGGQTGLVFAPRERRWSLIVERPDPRVIANMVDAGAKPGQPCDFFIRGDKRRHTYTRLASGENWKTTW